MAKRLPIIVLTGDAFERGRQHGAVFAARISQAVRSLPAQNPQLDISQIRRRADICWHQLDAVAADVKREIEGIAEGSGLSAIEIFMLNSFEFLSDAPQTGCTSLAIAVSGRAVIGQNWDAPPGTSQDLTLMIHRDGNEKFALVTSPGTLGWVGFNQHGLGFVTNDLMTDMGQTGIPSLVARRLILKHRHVAEAVASLTTQAHLSGRCYLFADATGKIAGVELSPAAGLALLAPDHILHTNHPLTEPIASFENKEASDCVYPSSRDRMKALTTGCKQLANASDIEVVLANRFGAPDAISKSVSDRERTETAFSIVYDTGARTVRLCLGRPDQNDYYSIGLSSLV